ncbi:hypothetical protein ACFLVE_01675 [Chloroflexota bacterium]
MVSEKQLIANRINARLGGVKTESGKANIRLNAVTHGILTKEALLPNENASELKKLQENLMAEKEPFGEVETLLVDRIVSCIWRLRRVIHVETGHLEGNWSKIAATSDSEVARWQSMNRYETALERQLYKALHELERIQGIRQGRNVPAPIAIDLDISNQG